MQLKSEVLPEPLGPITARVSPSARVTPTPPSAWIPPKASDSRLTSSSAPISPRRRRSPPPSELRGKDLVAGDGGERRVGRLLGLHQPDGVQAVPAVRSPGDRRPPPFRGPVLDGLHRLDEALPGEVAAGAVEPLHRRHHRRRPGQGEALAPLELRILLEEDLDRPVGLRLAGDGAGDVVVRPFPEVTQQPE